VIRNHHRERVTELRGAERAARGALQFSRFACGVRKPGRLSLRTPQAKSEYVWGVRLVLRTDRRGLPLAYTLVPANEHEYEPLLDLVETANAPSPGCD